MTESIVKREKQKSLEIDERLNKWDGRFGQLSETLHHLREQVDTIQHVQATMMVQQEEGARSSHCCSICFEPCLADSYLVGPAAAGLASDLAAVASEAGSSEHASAASSSAAAAAEPDEVSLAAWGMTPCHHAFHHACLDGWLQQKQFQFRCPTCLFPLSRSRPFLTKPEQRSNQHSG